MALLDGIFSVHFLAIAFSLTILSYILIGSTINYRKLRHIRGPPLAAYSRFWLFWQEVNAQTNKAQFAAIQKYGSPARIGPDLVVTDDPDLVRHMNAPNSSWRRSGWYEGLKLDPRLDTVFSTRDEKLHADLKSKEAGGYNGRDIDTLEPDIDSQVIGLLDLIKTTYSGKPMDVSVIIRFFTLDVLSIVAFGRPFGFMAKNEDLWDYNKETSQFLMALLLVANHKSIRRVFFALFPFIGPKETDQKGIGPVIAFARKAVRERFGPDAKVRKDMLGHFVNKGLDQLRCEAEANLQIVAGSDSTTTVLRSTLFLLASHPVAYMKLRSEIDAADSSGSLSKPVVTHAESQKLKYLSACVWEGLRLYPPLFGLKGKLAPPGGDTFKGVYYPAGTEVSTCDDAMQRREDIFGSDSHLFRPDRWIEADEETLVKFRRTTDCSFGSGRFVCLGRHIAFIELHKALVELLRNFDWQMADPMRGIDTHAHGVHCQSNMWLSATPRQLD